MFATEDERQQCANLMTGAPQNEGFEREMEIIERVRRSDGGEEEGQVALLEARYCIPRAFFYQQPKFLSCRVFIYFKTFVLSAAPVVDLTS